MVRKDFPTATQSLPSLSQTSNAEPSRTLFAMGLTVAAMLFLATAWLRFSFVAVLVRNSPAMSAARSRHVNSLAFLIAFIYALLLALVACFDSRDFGSLHIDFAYAFFAVASIYNALQAWLDWTIVHPSIARLRLRDGSATPWLSRRHAKVVLVVVNLLVAITLLILVLAHADYTVASVFEYLTMALLLLFWIAIGGDFDQFTVTLVSKAGPRSAEPGVGGNRVVQLQGFDTQ